MYTMHIMHTGKPRKCILCIFCMHIMHVTDLILLEGAPCLPCALPPHSTENVLRALSLKRIARWCLWKTGWSNGGSGRG